MSRLGCLLWMKHFCSDSAWPPVQRRVGHNFFASWEDLEERATRTRESLVALRKSFIDVENENFRFAMASIRKFCMSLVALLLACGAHCLLPRDQKRGRGFRRFGCTLPSAIFRRRRRST